jgi:hypothetical protein
MVQSGMARDLAGLATQNDGVTVGTLPVYAVRPNGVDALLGRLPAAHAAVVRLNNFSGALGSIVLLPDAEGTLAGAVLGLGDGAALHGFGAAATSLPADYAWMPQPGSYSAAEEPEKTRRPASVGSGHTARLGDRRSHLPRPRPHQHPAEPAWPQRARRCGG